MGSEDATTATLAAESRVATAAANQDGQTDTATSPTPMLDDLRAQLTTLQAEKESLSKKAQEALAQARGQQGVNARLQAQVKSNEEMERRLKTEIRESILELARIQFGESDPEPIEVTPYRQLQQRLTQRDTPPATAKVATEPHPQVAPPAAAESMIRIEVLAQEAEFDINSPPDAIKELIEDASDSFAAGKYAKAEKKIADAIKVLKGAKEKDVLTQRREEGDKRADALQGLAMDTPRSSGVTGKPTFTVSQIKDRAFWEENKAAILEAQKEGRIKEA